MTFYTKFIRYLYTLIYYLALPGILLRLLWKSRKTIEYRNRINERFGYVQILPKEAKSIWVHAVSLGETIAAIPLIKELIKRYPDHKIIVTTATLTGSEQVLKQLKETVIHAYSPYDIPNFINRFLKRGRVQYSIIMETELWPNMLRCCEKQQIPIMLANARLSERSERGYRWIASLIKSMLQVYIVVAAQSALDGARFIGLGLNPEHLLISGNIKFDIEIGEALIAQGQALRHEWGAANRPVFIAASTHEGEEEIILKAFKLIREKIPNTLLVLVPRHPERFVKVAKLCEAAGYKIVHRSLKEAPGESADILIGDTIGELRLIYAASDVAFVGGSLVPIGGHNLIEPAAVGKPVLTGPNLQNFIDVSHILKEAGAAQIISDEKALAQSVINLFSSSDLCKNMGDKARNVVIANQGALLKHLEWVENMMQRAGGVFLAKQKKLSF